MGVEPGSTRRQVLSWIGINLLLVIVVFLPAWYAFLWLATSVSVNFRTDHSVWAVGIVYFMMLYTPTAIVAAAVTLLLLFQAKRHLVGLRLRAVTITISSVVLPVVILVQTPTIVRDAGDAMAIMAAAALFGLAVRLKSPEGVSGTLAQDQAGQV